MSKQYLGLGDYQMLEYRGVVRYLHLVMIAYLLLTHLALVADAKACAKRLTPLRLPSIQQLQETLRSQLWDDLIAHLETGQQTRVAALKIKELSLRFRFLVQRVPATPLRSGAPISVAKELIVASERLQSPPQLANQVRSSVFRPRIAPKYSISCFAAHRIVASSNGVPPCLALSSSNPHATRQPES